MFFGKKKDKNSINGDNAAPEKATKISPLKFSVRMGNVFDKMYQTILSVDIKSNIYRVESGTSCISGKVFPVAGKFDDLLLSLSEIEEEETGLKGLAAFSREELTKAFKDGASEYSVLCCLREDIYDAGLGEDDETDKEAVSAEDSGWTKESRQTVETRPATEYHYVQLRADRIPEDSERTRLIVYVREVSSKNEFTKSSISDNQVKPPLSEEWEHEAATLAYGGKHAILFTYDIDEDTIIMKSRDASTTIQSFIKGIDGRVDWNMYYDDIKVIKRAFKKAKEGERIKERVRMREDLQKNKPFHIHRLNAAPVYSGDKVVRIMGAFSDIDAWVKEYNQKYEITMRIDECLTKLCPHMYEIDLAKDIIYEVQNEGDGFNRVSDGKSFTKHIERYIKNKAADEESRVQYRSLLDPKFLEKKTVNGVYEFETRIYVAGSADVKYYNETFYKLSGDNRYLNICRDISDTWKERDKGYKKKTEKEMSDYNTQMLAVMAELVEFRNVESGLHINNVCKLTRIILEDVCARSPHYNLTDREITIVSQAAMIHDIGKITIPDKILNKPGRLTDEEYEVMKSHTLAGYDILERMKIKGQEEIIKQSEDIVLHHHERYDGNGYPHGIIGDAISIGAQIVGLVDAIDAMASKRCYKDAMPIDVVLKHIENGECGAFNPKLIESMKACESEIRKMYEVV